MPLSQGLLPGWNSIKNRLVDPAGLEPAASSLRTTRSSQLSYTPAGSRDTTREWTLHLKRIAPPRCDLFHPPRRPEVGRSAQGAHARAPMK